jgi:uncharacterized protein YhbP (UPF0306 family)
MQSVQQIESVLLREYVINGKLMQVATVDSDNKPWLVHVWYAPSSQLELIFTSNVVRLHSDHIRTNSAVAGGIIAIDLKGLGQKGLRGITFTGNAHECAGSELEEAYETYATRWSKARESFPLTDIKSGESPMRMYKITPTQFVLFDEENYPKQPKRVIHEW